MICNKLKECVDELFSGKLQGTSCVNGKNNCIDSFDKRSQVKCEEKGKRYIYCNTKGVEVINYRMDGGVIKMDSTVPSETQKCDHVIVAKNNPQEAIFVELKGKDVKHAFEQLLETVGRERALVKACGKIYARIIMTSSTPQIQTCKAYKELKKLILSKGGNIKLHTRQYIENDIELDDEKKG